MADIYAIFGTLIALGLTFPALLTLWWILFPELVARSRTRLVETPKKCFGAGLLSALAASLPAALFFGLPSQFTQVLGWIWVVLLLASASLAAAGIASIIGDKLAGGTGPTQPWKSFLTGALVWELAAVFPLIGWLLVFPVGLVISLGAGVFAIFNWMPKTALPAEAS